LLIQNQWKVLLVLQGQQHLHQRPLSLSGNTITEITIRKPNVKALSGVSLQAIYQHDVNALIKVLPRVTTPALTPQQVLELDPVDFAQLGGHLVTFLYPKDLQKAIKEDQQ
jgi:hypothetical protein